MILGSAKDGHTTVAVITWRNRKPEREGGAASQEVERSESGGAAVQQGFETGRRTGSFRKAQSANARKVCTRQVRRVGRHIGQRRAASPLRGIPPWLGAFARARRWI